MFDGLFWLPFELVQKVNEMILLKKNHFARENSTNII